jgi:hypothetical protein
MKKFIALLTFAMSTSFAYAGKTCSPLDYEELKDMPEQELVAEYCQNIIRADNLIGDEYLTAMMRGNRVAADNASNEASQCRNQAKRIERILAKAGRTVTYASECQK